MGTGHSLKAGMVALAVLAAGSLAACTQDPEQGLPTSAAAARLVTPASCDELVAATRSMLGSYLEDWSGLERINLAEAGSAASEDAAGPATTAAAATPTDATATVAGINQQEAGVVEGDPVATDGRRIVTVVDGVLRVTVLDDAPAVDGSVDLRVRRASELLLRGEQAVVIGGAWGTYGEPVPVGGPVALDGGTAEPAFPESTTITLVDLSDPNDPRVQESVEVEGTPVATRMVDGTVRVVLRSTPSVLQELWNTGDPARARAVLARMDEDDVLPRARLDGAEPAAAGTCEDVLTASPATTTSSTVASPGVERVTVLTVGDSLSELSPVSVQGAAETVYASTEALFVASGTWDVSGPVTTVHRFDLTGRGPATYAGSGQVPGSLLDRYSLSQRNGDLRVVTTVEDPAATTSGRLAVLRPEGDRLVEVGHLDDLGVGEQVRSVRFLDDMAYVVTFRRTDPLFAVTVADPAAPRVLGELKIPGFSEYLHPVGNGLLLGVGREVDPDTLVDTGLKLSLFDVADPTAPAERGTVVLADSWSPVAQDPHAFTWDPVRNRALLPVDGPAGSDLLVLDVAGGRVAERARLRHDVPGDGSAPILRSLVIDSTLWTVSTVGLGSSDAADPAGADLVAY